MGAILKAGLGTIVLILVATANPKVTAQSMPTLKGHKNTITCLAFSKDGKLLATGAKDGVAIIWDVKATKELFSTPAHKDMVTSVAISPDGKVLATSGHDSIILLWATSTDRKSTRLNSSHLGISY